MEAEAIARALANQAFAGSLSPLCLNLVLVGRNPEKLASVSHEIREKCHCQGHGGIEVKSVVVDFSRDKIDEGIKAIEEEIRSLDLGVVVNNVGVCYPLYMHEFGEEQLQELIRVNVEAATRVTHLVLPHMMKRKKKKKGAIKRKHKSLMKVKCQQNRADDLEHSALRLQANLGVGIGLGRRARPVKTGPDRPVRPKKWDRARLGNIIQ
ncbi:Very-long-chain 3-oxoacyl-CoA reductase 1 [Nymphaea thermarum]|nr:Very-long-chain 3-oxoacyl-CoA reductase 1 [Nymphaea thermarum]